MGSQGQISWGGGMGAQRESFFLQDLKNKMEIALSRRAKSKPCKMGPLLHLDTINIFSGFDSSL